MKPFPARNYVLTLAPLLALWIGAAASVVDSNIREAKNDLAAYGNGYLNYLNRQMINHQAILMGFSTLFSAIGDTDPTLASSYARQVMAANPEILTLENVRPVAPNRRDRIHIPALKSMAYDLPGEWPALNAQVAYQFMEPSSSGSKEILGLVEQSEPLVQQAMNESSRRRTTVASHPFRLVGGNLVYAVFTPSAETFPRENSHLAHSKQNGLLVEMIIDVSRLANPAEFPLFKGGTVVVYDRDFAPDNPKGQLMNFSGKSHSPLETVFFPAFVYMNPLATMGEPFALRVKRQVGWSDFDLGVLALIALLAILSSLTLVAYLKSRQQDRVAQGEDSNRLWRLATHDGLTGLPNRMLLMDLGAKLLARMQRQNMGFAVLFLDLDDFKKVNTQFGRELGDQLLKFVADRLRAAVRIDDGLARIGCDDFIIVIERVTNRESLDAVKEKIQQKLSHGFLIGGRLIHLRASIGVAIFPEDGDSLEALLNQAELRMYAHKKARAVKLHLV